MRLTGRNLRPSPKPITEQKVFLRPSEGVFEVDPIISADVPNPELQTERKRISFPDMTPDGAPVTPSNGGPVKTHVFLFIEVRMSREKNPSVQKSQPGSRSKRPVAISFFD